MRLISLNIWGGCVRSELFEFIKNQSDIDIFCFQEVYHNALTTISKEKEHDSALNSFAEIQKLLPNHRGFFRPIVNNSFGLASFISKKLDVLSEGDIKIYENPNYPGYGPTHSRNLQWFEVSSLGKHYVILNVHALWNGQGKKDTPERIEQSTRIRNFIQNIKTPLLMCGDFNLRPDTHSVEILEDGMNNLIKLYNVTSTRTRFYPKEERFADYVFTSPGIKINHFEVLKDEVSDHSPLLVDFI